MRTYERGVENETLACGTGAVACALAASVVKGLPQMIDVKTQSNAVLKVSFQRKDLTASSVQLHGPAAIVFSGKYPLHIPSHQGHD